MKHKTSFNISSKIVIKGTKQRIRSNCEKKKSTISRILFHLVERNWHNPPFNIQIFKMDTTVFLQKDIIREDVNQSKLVVLILFVSFSSKW